MTMDPDEVAEVPHRVAMREAEFGDGTLRVEREGEQVVIGHWPGGIDLPNRGRVSLWRAEVEWLVRILPRLLVAVLAFAPW